jgi:polysaccharide export outer membrane protein
MAASLIELGMERRTVVQLSAMDADVSLKEATIMRVISHLGRRSAALGALTLAALLTTGLASAQTATQPTTQGATRPTPSTARPATPQGRPATATASTGIPTPTDYVIGPDDLLGIVFWRDADMTQDVTVRPDGLITLPLLSDIKAAGLKPEELRDQIQKAAVKFIADPNVTVVVRQINSRNAFITGEVARPGPYPISGQMTVLQLIAVAGGLSEYADRKNITITRSLAGKVETLKFNYQDVARGKNLAQNIVLRPGDTVVVP